MEYGVVSHVGGRHHLNDDEAALNIGVVDALNVATLDFGEGNDLIVFGVVLFDQVFNKLLTCLVCLLLD
jgi:hypothetical protein